MTFFIFGSSSCSIFDHFAIVRSTSCISVCAMSRLNLVTFHLFGFLLDAAVPLGLSQNDVTSRRVTFLHLAVTLGDVTFPHVM